MPLKKQKKPYRVGILVPCYKRNEYSEKCLLALHSAQDYDAKFYTPSNKSLRKTILNFFEDAQRERFEFIAKIDNDCKVPVNWLNDMLSIFANNDVDILSPNVLPSNAAYKYGRDEGLDYMPSEIVGGLWCMRRSLLDDLFFENYDVNGIKGAFSILRQILNEKEPKVGWCPKITVEDMGHWSGTHKEHIKSKEHLEYSDEVGRNVIWG